MNLGAHLASATVMLRYAALHQATPKLGSKVYLREATNAGPLRTTEGEL